MHIPGGRQDYTKTIGSSFCPHRSFLANLWVQSWGGGTLAFEDASIALLPQHPGDQQCCRREAFAHGLRCRLLGGQPPLFQGGILIRGPTCQLQSGERIMPYLPPEGAADEQVVHCLWLLVTRTQRGWGCRRWRCSRSASINGSSWPARGRTWRAEMPKFSRSISRAWRWLMECG
jgi:hypothetical protein